MVKMTLNKLKKKFLVKDVMLNINSFPILDGKSFLKEVLESMEKFKLGIACIVDSDYNLEGIITDGDLRRNLLKVQRPLPAYFLDNCLKHSILNPLTIYEDDKLIDSINEMEKKHIWDLPVISKSNKLVGMLHMHQALKKVLNNKNND